MEPVALSQLLNLPAADRADLATELALTDEQGKELDRLWADHLADPSSAIPWSEVRRNLIRRK